MVRIHARSARVIAVLGVAALGVSACGTDDAKTSAAKSEASSSTTATSHSHDMADMDHSHDMEGMDHGSESAVDDRGFSELANGEEHSHGFTQAISKEDRVVLAHQMELARETALRYPTVKDAEAAGLHRAGPFSPGLGAHYVDYTNALGYQGGPMTDADIEKPLAWIYDGTHPDSRVAGLFYMSTTENPVGFAGPNDTWHVHRDICLTREDNGTIDAPLGADHGATKAECDAVGGQLLKQTQYLVHVWVVPGYESPEGVYSHLSSAITCDDGTYNMIPDVTKVGKKTTMCVDGTE